MTSFELRCAAFGLGMPKPGIIRVTDPAEVIAAEINAAMREAWEKPAMSYKPTHIAVSTRRYRVTRYYKGRRYVFTDSIYDVLRRLSRKEQA